MSYNYELCFWDPNDEGVNPLLEHISEGIKSCTSMINFFKQRGELEKDYARRLGAINNKLRKDMDHYPEYGHLSKSFEMVLANEKARTQAHLKQSEIIYRQVYSDVKSFAEKLQARYTTLSGKVERLRMDKYNKKVGCENLQKRLEEAKVRARDLHLNTDNLIGNKRNEQNEKELTKWETTAQEMGLRLDVLKREYKSSQKYWFREWAAVTKDLQEMETARITFLKTKLQQYDETVIETNVLEQTKMDALSNQLITYTPDDDISDFSSTYGTGRLKERHKSRHGTSYPQKSEENTEGHRKESSGESQIAYKNDHNFSASKSRRSSYMDNLRRLSSHLQSIGSPGETGTNRNSSPPILQRQFPLEATRDLESGNEREELSRDGFYSSTVREARIIEPSSSRDFEDTVPHSRYVPTRMSPGPSSTPFHVKELSSASSTTSSNPTEITTQAENRRSLDSMTTSVSSFVNSIDDSQRFAKSWNSSKRKRKSISYVDKKSPPQSPCAPVNYHHGGDSDIDNISYPYDRDEYTDEDRIRNVSTDTTVVNPELKQGVDKPRRKSLVGKSSLNPIDDALYEMQKISTNGFAASDINVGRIRDSGITVTLPLVTSDGESVIKYAKAIYPLCEDNVPELAQFHKGDYLLITAEVNQEWYRGEVYSNDYVRQDNNSGLIPHNFIKLLT